MTTRELAIATLNLENGEHIDLLPDLVAEVPQLDVLLLQEGREWDRQGQKRRFQAESMLAPLGLDRSFLTRSTRGTLHELVFVRSARLRPMAHYTPDLPDVFHDQAEAVELLAGGLMTPLTVRSAHWPHWSGDARLSEALKLTRYAALGACAVIAGDFNSLFPDCETHVPEFEPDWAQLPPHKRQHKTLPPGLRSPGTLASDRRALSTLAEAGLRSAGCIAGGHDAHGQRGSRPGSRRPDRPHPAQPDAGRGRRSRVLPGPHQRRREPGKRSPYGVGAARPDPGDVQHDPGRPVTASGTGRAAAGTSPGASLPGWLCGRRVTVPDQAGSPANPRTAVARGNPAAAGVPAGPFRKLVPVPTRAAASGGEPGAGPRP